MSTINLYEDQAEFVSKIREALKLGYRSILGVASPAFGKTVVAGYITSSMLSKNRDSSSWFIVHRKNLLRQTSKSFWSAKIAHGLITSGRGRSNLPVQVGTIGTVFSRMDSMTPPKILFVDEAHLSRSKMFESVIRWVLGRGGIVIGLTGTPERFDGKALGSLFEVIVEAKSTAWLIEQGRLSDYDIFSTPKTPDMSGARRSGGDYNIDDVEKIMNVPSITGDAISHWKKHADGLRTVIYCANVAHAKDTARAFNEAGIPAVSVDGNSTEEEIKDACEGLAERRYKVLTNCELVIEGFDLAAQVGYDVTLECCVLLRPTKSLARYLQMVFRVMRKKPNKAIILDHAGCARIHGMPCETRQWTLEGRTPAQRKKAEEEAALNVQVCQNCHHTFLSGVKVCPFCGGVVPFRERKIVVIEGELEKLDRERIEAERKRDARREQGQARSLYDLVRIGVSRSMKNPAFWAATVSASREHRKPTPSEIQQARKIQRELAA